MVCAAVNHSLTAVSAMAAQNHPRLARCTDNITGRMRVARSFEFHRSPAGPVERVLAEGARIDAAENLAAALGQANRESLETAILRLRDRVQEAFLQDDRVVAVAPADDELRAVGLAAVRVGAGHEAVRAGERGGARGDI